MLAQNVENEYAKTVLNDVENLTEEKIDELLNKFMKDFKEGSLEKEGWRTYLSAYTVSKAALNAYTRLLANKYPDFLVNSLCPGYVKTDINCNTGFLTPLEGAQSAVRLALLPQSGPSGANKGIGFEICKQLSSKGVVVVLTSRDEKRGLEAVEKLKESEGLSDYVIFHQLDVTDPASIASLADFIKTHFGKLDILVNNAGIPGAMGNADAFVRAVQITGDWPEGEHVNWKELATQTFETAEECLNTNYYGAKRMVEALAPLLQLSDSARIVNISSFLGLLERIPNEKVKGALSNVESLTEEQIDEILNKLLKDVKEGSEEKEGWPSYLSAYSLSKAAMNAYTRILAKKNPTFLVNCVCPGFVKTDINCNTGPLTVAQGADGPVKLALLPYGGSSGLFFRKDQVSCF
ncbi:hypothetical protein Q3G72_005726 [Acer saccharum]|nr:hypothetical protein Q3G72_005726 [Acer saccharum]